MWKFWQIPNFFFKINLKDPTIFISIEFFQIWVFSTPIRIASKDRFVFPPKVKFFPFSKIEKNFHKSPRVPPKNRDAHSVWALGKRAPKEKTQGTTILAEILIQRGKRKTPHATSTPNHLIQPNFDVFSWG